jgi:hypothetical protein
LITRLGYVKSDWSDEILVSAANMQAYRVHLRGRDLAKASHAHEPVRQLLGQSGLWGLTEATIKVSA